MLLPIENVSVSTLCCVFACKLHHVIFILFLCGVSVCCKVRPTPSSWSLDSVKERAPSFSDNVSKPICPPIPPRPQHPGKMADPLLKNDANFSQSGFWHFCCSRTALLFSSFPPDSSSSSFCYMVAALSILTGIIAFQCNLILLLLSAQSVISF